MPLPAKINRVRLPYDPKYSLPNNDNYTKLGKHPVPMALFDAEFNWVTDTFIDFKDAINGIVAGNIPGSNDPNNANKLLKTDGYGILSWVLVESNSIGDNAITTRTINNQAVTTEKIMTSAITNEKLGNGSVTSNKIAPFAITNGEVKQYGLNIDRLAPIYKGSLLVGDNGTGNIVPLMANSANLALMSTSNYTKPQFRQITGNDIANASIPAGKYVAGSITSNDIASNSVITSKISDKNVTAAKINSGNAAPGSVLTADGAGGASFLLNQGKVLQIKSRLFNIVDTSSIPQANTYYSFTNYPSKLSIQPRSATSAILVFLNFYLGAAGSFNLYGGIFKNNEIWKFNEYQGFKRTFSSQVSNTLMANFSNMFFDSEHDLNPIDYELKFASNIGANASLYLNTCSGFNHYTISSMIAIEIDL